MSSSGPNTCRRSARSRNVSESSESSAWLSSDGRGNVDQTARQFRCPADSGSHSDNNSPERVKRKKRRKNVHDFSAEEHKRAMKRRVAEFVKQNRLGDELLRIKLKDSRVPLVLLKRLEHKPISQPKPAVEHSARTKRDDESLNQKKLENVPLNQKKLADIPQAQVRLSNEAPAPEKHAEETRVHVKLAVELPAKANASDEPRPLKRPVGRPPKSKLVKEPPQPKFSKELDQPKLSKGIPRPKLPKEPPQSQLSNETPQPKLAKETPQPKLAKETLQPKLAKETPQPKLAKETPKPKLAKETPQPKLAKETPQPKLAIEIPQLKLAKETPQPKLVKETPQPKLAIEIPQLKLVKETPQVKLVKETPQVKLVKETPQVKLVKETPQAKLVRETPLPKLANETPQPKLLKEPSESKLAKDSSQPKLIKDSSQPKVIKDSSESKLVKEPSQPKLAETKSAEEQSEEKKEYFQQECAQKMSNVILPRTIDPSILRRRVFVRINKRQTDRLVAKKLSLQRRLLKELSLEKERTSPIAEPTPVNSGDSDKCATRLTEKSNDCLTDVNTCTKNPIVSGKKQLQIPIDKSNNDRLPEKLLEDNSTCTLNSLSLSQTSIDENQPESSKSFIHSYRKNKRKTIDQINDKVSVDLVAIEPKCIKDTIIRENEKHSDDSSKDVKKYSKTSVKEIEKLSEQIIVKCNKTNPKISGDSDKKRFSAKEIRERRTKASCISKVLKNSSQIRTRPRRNLASKSDSSVDSSFDSNEKLSKKLNKEVIQHNIKCQAESDKIVNKNEAEKCDIQSTVEKTLDSKDKSIEKCSKTSKSGEILKYSKDETKCNKVLEKSNIKEKLHSEGVIENRVIENFVKCGDNLPEKLNKNVNKRIKNQTEKSITSTRNIQSKIEKQADNAQENHSSLQSIVKENDECQSNNLDIVIEKYNNDSKESIESSKRNLEKAVNLVEESSENNSKNSIEKEKRFSKKSVQSSVDGKTESLSNSISDAVKDVCEKTVQISVENKNENISKHFDEKIKKNIKVAIKQVKYQKTNVDTLCEEKLSKNAEKTEYVEKHNKKHLDAKDKGENQISFNLADVNQRPKRNVVKRNLEIYANSCTLSKTENDIDKHNERLLEDLNKSDAVDVSKRKSRKLLNKEHLENVEQSKLENEKLPVEKSNEKVPEMLNVNTTDIKPETAIGKRSKKIIAHDKNVKITENLIISDVDNKEIGMKENENQVAELQKKTESYEETEVQNNMIVIPALPQKLDKMNVNLIENVPDSVHVNLKTVTKDLNEASSNTTLAVPKRRGRRRKSLPDATEKIISHIVKSASIPDDLQNQIELQNDFVMCKDIKDNIKKSDQSSVNLIKKYTRLQVTIEKRITRNSVPEEKSIKIPHENKIDLVMTKVDSNKPISDKTESNENLHKIDLVIDHQEKPIENSETSATTSVQNDGETTDHLINNVQNIVVEDIKIQIVNQKRITRKTLLNVNSEDTKPSMDECKTRIVTNSIPDTDQNKSDALHKINSVHFYEEKPSDNSEEIVAETVQDSIDINGDLENSRAIIIETIQNDVHMNDEQNEDLQKAIKEIPKSENKNQKRITRKASPNKREKQLQNSIFVTSENNESSADECKKRMTRKSISDKTKSIETLHKAKSILDHQGKPIENTKEVSTEVIQSDFEKSDQHSEDLQTAITENTKSQIVNKKRLTKKALVNKHEKVIESILANSEDTEITDITRKRVTRKSVPDTNKVADSFHNNESILDHPEKPIEDVEQIIKEDVQNVEINGCTEESQKAIIENTKSRIVNLKRVTRRSSLNKREKQIESTPAISENTEDSSDKSKKRVTRKSIADKNKIADSLNNDESILDHPVKPIENGEQIIKDVQNVEINGYTEESQEAIIENTKSQIVNQKRLTRRSCPNKREKQIENTPASSEDIEDSTDKTKKRITRKSIPDKSKVIDSLHNNELILDHPEKPNENDEEIIKDAQNDEINGHTEESQEAIVENSKSPFVNEKRVTWKSLPNKHEKLIENSTSAISEDTEASLDECKNKSGSVKRTTRKERLEKCVDSVSISDDKIAEEPQKINKESSKSEKVSRKVSPDKYDKQTENLIINNLETVMNSIDEADKIFSETLDNKENTKTQIEVNARVTRNSSLKKHNKNLIENNVDCVHNEDNKDRSLENAVSTVKVFSKNLTDNKKFRKTSVDKVNEIQTENLIDNSSASLQNLIEENDQKQFEGSLKRRSKELTESVKRKSTQSDSEVNSVNSLDEKHFSTIDDNKKSTIVVENNKRVTRKSAEMHSEEIAKDSAKLTDHYLLPETSEKSVAVSEESDKDSSKIVQSDVSKSLAEAKGLVNSIKSFNEHNDTCTEILQVSDDVNSESQPNNNKLMCSELLTAKCIEDTKTTVATEKSEKLLECSAASLTESSLVQQTTVNNKNDSISEEQSTKCSKRVSLRAFRKVKENKPVPISDSSSVTTIVPIINKEENRAESLNENLIHTVVESVTDSTDRVTKLADNLISSTTATVKNVISDVQKIDDSSNISSPNLESNEKLTLNSSQKSNENDLESTCENANATITARIVAKLDENVEKLQPVNATVTESIADKLDENVEKLQPVSTTVTESIVDKLDENVEQLQDTNKTVAKDTELIENQEVNENSSSNQDSNEISSENSFKSALDVVTNELETLAETSNPIEEHEVSDLNNLEIPHLDSLCSVEAFPASTAEEPLEEALNNLELPSSETLNSLENSLIPTFESPNLDSAIETGLEDIGSSSDICSKTLETSVEKTPENEESAKKNRLVTLLELKRKCTENLDKKQTVDDQNHPKEAIDPSMASGSLDSIDPSSDSCLGNATENEENFESLSDEFDDENLASRLANLNDLKIPPLTPEQDSSLVFDKEDKKEKPASKLGKSFLEMNAMTCMYCDKCFNSNRELKKHVKVQHRQRLVIKITKTDSNEHKTQLVEPTENSAPEQEPPLVTDVDSIPPSERFPMVAEEEPITDGEIKIIVKKESGSKNSHVVKEIKITPKSLDGGSSVRIPGFSPALSDVSAGGSSINSPALDTSGVTVVKKPRGRPRKYPIFTENEIMAKQMAAQVLAQEQERVKRQLQINTTPVFEPVESIIPPFDEKTKADSVVEPPPEVPKERVKRKRKLRVFDNDDTEEEEIPPVPIPVKKRRGRPPRKKPEQLLRELNERLQQAQKSTQSQSVNKSPNLQQGGELQQVQEQNVPKSQPLQEPLKPQPTVEQLKIQPTVQEIPKSQVPHEPSKPLQRPIPALVPSSVPIRFTSSLPLPLLTPTLTPTLRPTAVPPLKQTPIPPLKQMAIPPLTQTAIPPLTQTAVPPLPRTAVPPLTQAAVPPLTQTAIPPLQQPAIPPLPQTAIPPLTQTAIPSPTQTVVPPPTQTAIPPLRQTSMPFLIPSLTPSMSMPSLSPLTRVSSPLPEVPDTDEKRRKLVESLQEFIVIGPEEKKRRLEGASGQEMEDQAAAPESPDATDVSKPEKGLLTRKFGMTKELVVRLTKIDTVPKDCEDFNGDVDDSERIDGDPKANSDERLRRKLKPKLPNEEGEESSRESLSSVVRMNLRRKLENNNNHVNDVEKCLATTDSPRTQPSDGQTPEATTLDAAKKQSDPIVQQEATDNQLVVTPRRPAMDKAEVDQSQKAKLMMLMNATTPAEATNKSASNNVTETPRAQPQSQPQVQMQLQHQPQNQLQVHQQSQPLHLAQMQHKAHPQPQPQVQLPVQTQPQTVMQLQQPQQFCILFIPDYDGNGPRDVAPTATIVNFQPVPDNEIHNKPLIYMPTTPTKISVDDHAKAYVCANCTKVLDLIGRLEANVGMTEEDKSAITCPYCSNHFQSLFYLEYHVMHEHLKCENEKQCRHSRVNSLRIPNHEVATEFESYITFALKCRSCYDIFGSVLALNDHVMHKHKTLVRLKSAAPAISGPNAFPGPFVGKNGAIGAVLQCPSDCVCRIGIRSTDTPLQRQQMLKRCPNAMRRLEKIEPAAYEVYTCTLCKSTFLMKDEVIDHLMKMHEVSCKFPCYTCLTSFRSLQFQENHRCSETTLQDFDKLLNIAILPTNVGGKEHNNKFLEREDSSTDEYGAMKTTSPRAPPDSTATTTAAPVKNGLKRKNGATIAALSQLLSKKPKLMNTIAQPVLPSKRKRKRACPKCKKRFAYRKSLHDHVIYEHIMKGESADGPKKTAVELLMLLSNNRANYKRIEELAEMLNGYTDEDGVSLRKLAMMEETEQEMEEESASQSSNNEPRTSANVAQCIRCKKLFSPSVPGNPGQSSAQDDEQRKPLLCDNCEGIAGPKTRRRGPVNNGQHSDDESSDDSQSTSSQMLTFACKKCPDTFPTVIELKSHKLAVHAKHGVEHLYSCDICTKSFAAPRMLEKHKKIHRESVLDDSAKPEDETNRSSSQNSGDNSKDSEANDSLNDKMNSSNRRDSSDSSGAGSKEPEEQLLDCSFCEEVCSSKVSLKNHLKREHGRRASICQFCNGLLIDTSEVRHMLDYHIVPSKTNTRQTIVRNNGNILHCGDSCMQDDVDELIRTLGKHRLQSLMVYHDFEGKCNNAIMRCPICPELFATRESCRFHYVWIHDDNCLLCDETFRSGSSACQHKVDAHTSTASYLWCIQRLVTAIVNTLNLDPDQPSHVLYQVLAMRLDDEEEEARIASESTAGDTAEKGTNEETSSATERFLEEVLSEDQLPDSGNMIEVVIGREDSEDDLLSMLNLSPNYETCEQLPNASAAPPEEEEEEDEEVPPAPTSPTVAATSVIVPAPTTPTTTASTSLATTVSSPIASSPTTVTTASPVLGNYCASGVYLCKHSDGDEQFVLVVAGEDEITYKNDIGSLAVRISETCEVFTLDEITEMLRVHFANLNQNSDGSA